LLYCDHPQHSPVSLPAGSTLTGGVAVVNTPRLRQWMLAGVASNQLDRLRSVMNAAARLVCSARKSDHITPLLRDLHCGYERHSGSTSNSLCSSSAGCVAWYGSAIPCTRTMPCGRHKLSTSLRRSSCTFHRRVTSPSATALSQSPQLLAFVTVCHLTSSRRHC